MNESWVTASVTAFYIIFVWCYIAASTPIGVNTVHDHCQNKKNTWYLWQHKLQWWFENSWIRFSFRNGLDFRAAFDLKLQQHWLSQAVTLLRFRLRGVSLILLCQFGDFSINRYFGGIYFTLAVGVSVSAGKLLFCCFSHAPIWYNKLIIN